MTFLVTLTYSEITPESATRGDFSDTGFIFQEQEYSLRELINYIQSESFYREGPKGRFKTGWFTTGFQHICFKTGTEREENLHIKLKV